MKITLTATRADDLERVIRHASALEDRGVTDVEIVVDYRDEAKPYLLTSDIMKKFDIGNAAALDVMRSVKEYCGDSLGKGKILPSELIAWERKSLDGQPMLERRRA